MQKSYSLAILFSITFFYASANVSVRASDTGKLAGKRVAFLGDSITQNGAYVSYAAYLLEKHHPDLSFEIYGLGLSSETVSGLSEENHAKGRFPRPHLMERLGRLLEKLKPEVVFACYGMNCGIYLPLDETRFAKFKQGINTLIDQCQAAGVKQIYLVTPPIYDHQPEKVDFNYDTVLTAYAKWETKLKRPGVKVIDLHSAMSKARIKRNKIFSRDQVHPGTEGHLFMALTILDALGLKLEVDYENPAALRSDALYKAVHELRLHRSRNWMKHIGYTRQKHIAPEPLGNTETEAMTMRKRIQTLKSEITKH